MKNKNIFTVEDKIVRNDFDKEKIRIIKSFLVRTNGDLWVHCDDGSNLLLSEIEHAKLPLFTTDDGEELFEGDKYYFVPTKSHSVWNIDELYTVKNPVTAFIEKDITFSEGVKVFATKEAAEKWIDENKPKYSKKDIINLIEKVAIESKHSLCCYLGREVDYESYSLIELANKIRCDETR